MEDWKFKRVLVLGCPGSGKSHFARRLAEITDFPLFHLDLIWHRADRTTVSQQEFDTRLDRILEGTRWIIDGNFQRTLARRLERCEAAFLFDLNLVDCLAGVEDRIGQKRPDMPWIENEFDPDFRQWIMNFGRDRFPEIMDLLANAHCEKIIFKSRSEADGWLRELKRLSSANDGQDGA